MHVSDCPSNEVLQALLLGKLRDDESRVYEAHIVGCEACGVRSRNIQASDPLLDLLPDVRNVVWSAAEEEESRQLVERFANRSKLLANTAHGGATILTGPIDAAKPREGKPEANVLTQSSISSSEPTTVPVTRSALGSTDGLRHTPGTRPAEGVTLGAYRLDKKLGEGGMGAVWKAFHTRLKKPVALKVLSAHLLRDPSLVARFEREMEAVGKLDHPTIVRAMDAGEIDGTHYLVMEYVEGTDFGQLVKTKGARTVRDACEMVRQAAVGLAYAHKNGLVHRDIKPSNLFLTKDGKVKVLDLGLARLQGEGLGADPGAGLTSTGQILGTPDYMAPEQWENTHTVGPACDLYALGCTLFYLLTGRAPFADEKHPSLPKKMLGHCEHVPPPLSAIRARLLEKVHKNSTAAPGSEARRPPAHDILPELEAIYDKLMAKDPAARFATADQLAAALAEIIKAKPPAPAPASPAPAPPLPAARAKEELSVLVKGASTAPAPPEPTASATQDAPSEPPTGSLRKLLLGFGGLAAALLFGVIIITIKNKDGTVTKLKVDDSAEISMSRKGDFGKPTSASVPQPSTFNPQLAVWHGWPADAPKPAIAPFDAAQAKRHQEEWAKYLNVPVEYTSPIGMTFRLIPPGEFQMGCTAEDVERILGKVQRSKYADESVRSSAPRHAVTLTRPFYLGAFEVTQSQYERVMNQNPAFYSASGGGKKTVEGQATPDHPVESVPWHDAETFCSKAGRTMSAALPVSVRSPPFDSQSVRLPTEAEWEFACRAGTTTRFWTGDDEEQLRKFAWVGSEEHAGWAPHTVGTRPPNPFGLCDMHGNVYEWVRDSWQPDFYQTFRDRPAIDPLASDADKPHIARGGWIDIPPYAESGLRNARGRNVAESWVGFRAALSVDSVRQALNNTGPTIPPVNSAARDTAPGAPGPSEHKWAAGAPKPAIAPFDAAQAEKHQEEWAAYLKVPVEYTDELGLTYRLIPPGTFTMGLPTKEYDRVKASYNPVKEDYRLLFLKTELPARPTTLTRPFYLATTEVNYGQFSHYVELSGAVTDAERDGWGLLTGPADKLQRSDQGFSWRRMKNARERGAGFLSWNDCRAMTAFLSTRYGLEYRLPSEAEWEYACRAGTQTLFSVGDTLTKDQAAIEMNIQPVGSFPPNAFGLRDMHGSVQEYVDDDWEFPSGSTLINVDPRRPPLSAYRIIRGGTETDPAISNRSSIRQPFVANGRTRMNGVRLSLTFESVQRKLGSSSKPASTVAAAASWHGWPADAPEPAIAPFDAAQAKKHQEEWAAYLKVPVEYTNSIGMKFRLIPPGEFVIGSTPEEIARVLRLLGHVEFWRKCTLAEGPQQIVTLTKPFYLGSTEVTQTQYEQITGKNPSVFCRTGPKAEQQKIVAGMDTATFPVEFLTWGEAAQFCVLLSQAETLSAPYDTSGTSVRTVEGSGYRLPTDAEWEYACRAGTTTPYSSGDSVESLSASAWFDNNADKRTHPVGTKAPNSFGLFDTHGNVWELTHDAQAVRSVDGAVIPRSVDPVGATDPDLARCLRGGSWFMLAEFQRSARCEIASLTNRDAAIGFRVTLPIEAVRRSLNKSLAKEGWHGWPADAPTPAIAPFDAAQAKKHQEEWAAYLKVPVEYTNSIGLKFRLIPPGEFLMGITDEEAERFLQVIPAQNTDAKKEVLTAKPQHRVVLSQPMFLGETEVTQQAFLRVLGRNPSDFSKDGRESEAVEGMETASFPVEMTTWTDVVEFCNGLSGVEEFQPAYTRGGTAFARADGDGYRVPTEAEWEFSCRAGTTTKFWTGDDRNELSQTEWVLERSGRRPHRVAESGRPNPFGLFDMSANVRERTEDAFSPDYYAASVDRTAVDPQRVKVGGTTNRGGNWYYPSWSAYSAGRSLASTDGRYNSNGFRVVLTVAAVRRALKVSIPGTDPTDTLPSKIDAGHAPTDHSGVR